MGGQGQALSVSVDVVAKGAWEPEGDELLGGDA